MIRRKHWSKFVRLARPQSREQQQQFFKQQSVLNQIVESGDDCAPETIDTDIDFVPQTIDKEGSVISTVLGKSSGPVGIALDEKTIATADHKGFREDYALGETIRSPSHMIPEATAHQAINAAASLKEHDFAFIKRSDGVYCYSILAYRSMELIKGSTEECMTFAMSDVRSTTKMIRRKHWSEFVRLVRPLSREQRKLYFKQQSGLDQEIERGDDWVPPRGIEFVPQATDAECSVMSSISDRARKPDGRCMRCCVYEMLCKALHEMLCKKNMLQQ
eukprot:CAMPEP_0172570432 /NCGR_PEP_ID=MMETSP1067-20121228/127546_1 /TAXON_ID=265564 ORGANISM="Thalassiosira punctigera, Strain Tpunct2005C2" /NCGR_SAMPLE_ID=MMETSP1067 /ASSEMBLY_ACC=CAM_ASM_000444 /LENGTH=274 /DNA_ID=CAMNT_0013362523 /DNA_START=93 /DNA_END=917 /DNA_ORIENTATION=-